MSRLGQLTRFSNSRVFCRSRILATKKALRTSELENALFAFVWLAWERR
jgi:hypothetical protein